MTLGPRARGIVGTPVDESEFSYHYDHVLGTSLDIWISSGDERDADSAVDIIFGEIERLRRIFSPVDPESELSRLNRATGPVACSLDLRSVLRTYEIWQSRTGSACSAQTSALGRLWRDAERLGRPPSDGAIAALLTNVGGQGWNIDEPRGTVTRDPGQLLDLNSVAKGYILEQAAESVRAGVPRISRLLVNLGGDMTMWAKRGSQSSWRLGVQDPFSPQENAKPLTMLALKHSAVATSGGYQRFFTIGGRRYSHLIDPRTGRPSETVAAATVIAPTSTLANLLATTLCILEPGEGLRLIEATPDTACLLVTSAGAELRSPGFADLEVPQEKKAVAGADEPPVKASAKSDVKSDPWPVDFQVNVAFELPKSTGGK